LSRALARIRWLAEARQLPKTVLALLAVASAVAALVLIPADFDLEARGELLPKLRREVFATDSGVIGQLSVDHAQQVNAGEPLLVIRKPELDLEFRRVAGEMQTAEKKLSSIQAERLENASTSAEARRRVRQLAADEEELKEELRGLREQYAILEQHREDLVVRSPIDGEAITWNIKELLEARPVERGQALLTVADLSGPWELELHLGDHRAGHLLAAREALKPELGVTFALLSDPGVEYRGTVSDVAAATELDEDGRPIVRVTVDFDRERVPALRTGATATAHIHCGRRAVGYVWLHDLFEFVQSHWWW
jgi:multidrug efflux pump subunit AcrA (membrane-fusion protein)